MERVSFCSQPTSPDVPPSLLWPAWSLGSLSTWQRIAEQFCQGQGPGHPISAPERAWVPAENTPPCLCWGAWFSWPMPSAAVPCWGRRAGLCWGGSCRMWVQGFVQTWPLWQKGTRLVLGRPSANLAFLRGSAPKLSHSCVSERCSQPSDPTIVGLTGSLLRGPLCVSS